MSSRVAAILAALAFIAALGTLHASLAGMDLGMENEARLGTGQGLASGELTPSDTTTRYCLAIGTVAVAAIAVVSVVAMATNARWSILNDIWKGLVALLIVLGGILFLQIVEVSRESGALGTTGDGGPLGVAGTDGGSTTGDTMAAAVPWLLLIALGVILGTAAFLAARHVLAPKEARRVPAAAPLTKRKRAWAILSESVDDLTGGVDVRTAVINCYLRMEALAERRRGVELDAMTPTEFSRWAAEELGVSGAELSAIVRLFEEARYSPHPMSEGMRGPAVSALKAYMSAMDRLPSEDEGEAPAPSGREAPA